MENYVFLFTMYDEGRRSLPTYDCEVCRLLAYIRCLLETHVGWVE